MNQNETNLNINIKLEIKDTILNNRDIVSRIYYPDEGNKIFLTKGLNKLEFQEVLLHEIGHLFDWYISNGNQSENQIIRERNADVVAYLNYKRDIHKND